MPETPEQLARQNIDVISRDALLYAGPVEQTTQSAAQLVTSFRKFIQKHQAEIAALQILYSRPYRLRLTEPMLKDLGKKLRSSGGNPPESWKN